MATVAVVVPFLSRPAVEAAGDPVLVAAGDIACDPAANSVTATTCQQQATSDLALSLSPDAIATLGDLQYNGGALTAFQSVYDPTWGRLNTVVHPVPGNHEYKTAGATGYYDYFGGLAGTAGQGYYSYDLGGWHLVALNSECVIQSGCASGQSSWLSQDLAAHPADCTLAYWHRPRFSSGSDHNDDAAYAGLWQTLYDAGADVVLNGHSHHYERYAPLAPNGSVDLANGIRELIAGTGGKDFSGLASSPDPGTEVRFAGDFGVLALTLHANGYDWRFASVGGGTRDQGTSACHGPGVPADTTAPSPPASLSATAQDGTHVALSWTGGDDETGPYGFRVYRDGQALTTLGAVGSYVDATASPGQTYAYSVVTVDAGGNESGGSPDSSVTTPSATPPPSATGLVPTDDAYVHSRYPNNRYGTKTVLLVDGKPVVDSLLRFDLSTLACPGPVTDLTLQLTVGSDGSSVGGSVYATDPGWSQSTVTWGTAPAAQGAALASVGPAPANTVRTVTLPPSAVAPTGLLSLRVHSTSANSVKYYAKESGTSRSPRLAVTCG